MAKILFLQGFIKSTDINVVSRIGDLKLGCASECVPEEEIASSTPADALEILSLFDDDLGDGLDEYLEWRNRRQATITRRRALIRNRYLPSNRVHFERIIARLKVAYFIDSDAPDGDRGLLLAIIHRLGENKLYPRPKKGRPQKALGSSEMREHDLFRSDIIDAIKTLEAASKPINQHSIAKVLLENDDYCSRTNLTRRDTGGVATILARIKAFYKIESKTILYFVKN